MTTVFSSTQEGPAGSQYSGQCEACSYRNEIKVFNRYLADRKGVNPSTITKQNLIDFAKANMTKSELYYWCVATASCNTGDQPCGEASDATRCVSREFFNAAGPGDPGGEANCPCTSCTDYKCMHDYVNPACARTFQNCGCAQTVSTRESQIGNDIARRPWTRGTLVCPAGASPDATPAKLEERRKAETLLHINNRDGLSAKRKWARLVNGRGPRGPRVWASQTQTVSNPNIRPCGTNAALCAADPTSSACQGCLVPKPNNPNVLVCTGKGPKLCSPNTSSDVPRSPDPTKNLICMDKNVPLTRFRHPNVVYASAGSTWPQTRWAPGYAGFPVGKAGSNAYERQLNIEKNVNEGNNIFGEIQSFNVTLQAVPETMCNRFSMDALKDALVCSLGANAKLEIDKNTVQNKGTSLLQFTWRKHDQYGGSANWKDLKGGDYPSFGKTSGSIPANWGPGGALLPTGDVGTIDINEPTTGKVTSTYERELLDIVCQEGGSSTAWMFPKTSTDAENTQANKYYFTCCGQGKFFSIDGRDVPTAPYGQLWYSGALNWTANNDKDNPFTGHLPVPHITMPPGYKTITLNEGDALEDYTVVEADGSRRFLFDPLTIPTANFPQNSYGPVLAVRSAGWNGLGCGQPGTLSEDGPNKFGPDTCKAYDCNTDNTGQCGSPWTESNPKGATTSDLFKDEQNPQIAGGTWAPTCPECIDPGERSNDGLSKDGAYITMTFNFGAYRGTHPSKPDGYATVVNKSFGMGQWTRWATLGKEQIPDGTLSGLTPELYTLTWYIDIASLTDAQTSDRTVDAWAVVVGKPSSGQIVDPRAKYTYAVDEATLTIDSTRLNGGGVGEAGSMVGTQAGGLGMRGIPLYPAIDVYKTTATITLCQ